MVKTNNPCFSVWFIKKINVEIHVNRKLYIIFESTMIKKEKKKKINMKLNFFNSTKSIIIGEEKIRPSGLLINYSPIVYRLFTVSIIVYFELEKRAFAVKS